MILVLALSLLCLILTKAADVTTTVRGLRRARGALGVEQNPLARRMFRRLDLTRGMALVLLLWALIAAACYVPAFFAPAWYQAATAAGGGMVAWAQWDVARANHTGRHSAFTRLLMASFRGLWRTDRGWHAGMPPR
jgi:hypothetical protein